MISALSNSNRKGRLAAVTVLAPALQWVWVVFTAPLSLYFLFGYWGGGDQTVTVTETELVDGTPRESVTTRPVAWYDIALAKAIAIVFLAIDVILLQRLLGTDSSDVSGRIAMSALGISFAGGFAFLAVVVVRSRDDLLGLTRLPPDSDIVTEAIEEGPSEAISARVFRTLARAVLHLPLGWLAVALVPATCAALLLVSVRNVWVQGSPIVTTKQTTGSFETASAVFEHVAFYVFWGGILIGSMVSALNRAVRRRGGAGTELAVVGFAAVLLAFYVLVAGLWL